MIQGERPRIEEKIRAGKFEGPEGAVELAESAYRANPDRHFLPLVDTLYRGRHHESCTTRLVQVRALAVWFANHCVEKHLSAHDANLLGTVLLFMSKHSRLSAREREQTIEAGAKVVTYGISLTGEAWKPTYARPFLLLTRVLYNMPGTNAFEHLAEVRYRVEYMSDINLRAHIYERLGYVLLKRLNPVGLWYLMKAHRTSPGSSSAEAEHTSS